VGKDAEVDGLLFVQITQTMIAPIAIPTMPPTASWMTDDDDGVVDPLP
jgi:hypothetical protein